MEVLDDVESRDDIDSGFFTNFTDQDADPSLGDDARLNPERIATAWAALKQVIVLRDEP